MGQRVLRLTSAALLVAAALLFYAPFASVGASPREEMALPRVEFIGIDFVTGAYGDAIIPLGDPREPGYPTGYHVEENFNMLPGSAGPALEARVPREPLAIAALAFLALGVLGTVIGRPAIRWSVVGASAVLAAGSLALAGAWAQRHIAQGMWKILSDEYVARTEIVWVEWGFAVSLGLMLVVGILNLGQRSRTAGSGRRTAMEGIAVL